MVGEVCGFLEEGPCWPCFFFSHVFSFFFGLRSFMKFPRGDESACGM